MIVTKAKITNVDTTPRQLVSIKSPMKTASTIEWGCNIALGVLNANQSITLPAISYNSDGFRGPITITAFQDTGNSYTITIQVGNTASETITDGDTNTTTVVLTPTALNSMEIVCMPVAVNQVSVMSIERECSAPPVVLTNMPVGGKIFYVNSEGSGVYTFYDSSHNVLSTQTVVGLNDAVTYDYVGPAPGLDKVDKFFVYDVNGIISNRLYWGPLNTVVGVSANTIGSGKINSNIIITNYASSMTNFYIWPNIINKRNNLVGGCNDWYVGSMAEIDQLILSGLAPSMFLYYSPWSSCEASAQNGYVWDQTTSNWVSVFKSSSGAGFAIRSF